MFVDGASIVDVTVYSRNRHFRLWRSSKVEKDFVHRPLRVAEENSFVSNGDLEFLMYLYVVVSGDSLSNILQYDTPQTQPGPSVAGGSSTKRIGGTRAVSSNPRLDQFVLDHMRSIRS